MNEPTNDRARSDDTRRSDLDVPMPGSGMGLDRDIDRDFTPEEARRALMGSERPSVGTTGTSATDLDIATSADVQDTSGGNGSSSD